MPFIDSFAELPLGAEDGQNMPSSARDLLKSLRQQMQDFQSEADICSHCIQLVTHIPVAMSGFPTLVPNGSRVLGKHFYKEFFFEDAFQCMVWEKEVRGPDRKAYRYLEAYLWTPTIREFLGKRGFLEGNYIFVNPRKQALILPYLDNPLGSVRLPHLDFTTQEGRLALATLTQRRFGKRLVDRLKQNLMDPQSPFRKYSFPNHNQDKKDELFKLILELCASEGNIEVGKLAGMTNKLKYSVGVMWENCLRYLEEAGISDSNLDLLWSKFVIKRLAEEAFYDLNYREIASWRTQECSFDERTEFLKFFRFGAEFPLARFGHDTGPMLARIEQETGSLSAEDGEVTLLLFESHLLNEDSHLMHDENGQLLPPLSPAALVHMGLISQEGDTCIVTKRAASMARWVQKLLGINCSDIVTENFKPLREGRFWKALAGGWESTAEAVTEPILRSSGNLSCDDAVELFRNFAEALYPKDLKRSIEEIRAATPFNINIHEFLRRHEPALRSLLAFPLTSVPSHETTDWMAVFIGTFDFRDGIEAKPDLPGGVIEAFWYDLKYRIAFFRNLLSHIGWCGIREVMQEEIEDSVRDLDRAIEDGEDTRINFAITSHGVRTRAQSIQASGAVVRRLIKEKAFVYKFDFDDLHKVLERLNRAAVQMAEFSDNIHMSLDVDRLPQDIRSVPIAKTFEDAFEQRKAVFLEGEQYLGVRSKLREKLQVNSDQLEQYISCDISADSLLEIKTSLSVLSTVFEEAIQNAFRSQATNMKLEVERIFGEPWILVRLSDNGAGFDSEQLSYQKFDYVRMGGLGVIRRCVERILKGRNVSKRNKSEGIGAEISFELPLNIELL